MSDTYEPCPCGCKAYITKNATDESNGYGIGPTSYGEDAEETHGIREGTQ